MDDKKQHPKVLTIDRFEGDYAVCESPDKQLHYLLKADLPAEATVGDVLKLSDCGYCIDLDETTKRKEENYDLFRSVFHKS